MTSQSKDSCLSKARRSWLFVTVLLTVALLGVVRYQANLFRAHQLENEARILLLEDLVQSSPRPIVVVNDKGVVVNVNPCAVLELGYSRQELVGQRIDVLIPKGCRQLHGTGFSDAVRQVRSARKLWAARHTKLRVVGKDGREQNREMTAYAVPKQDGSLEFDLLFDGKYTAPEKY